MRRMFSMILLGSAVVAGTVSLSGCIVAPPPRPYVYAPVRVWVPGYWYGGVWVGGHWGYR